MGIIHVNQSVILLCKVANLIQLRYEAVHGKDAVGGYEPCPVTLRFFQDRFQFVHVAVGIAETLRLAETDAVNDGGVVELIGNDCIFRTEQSFKEAAVGVEAGGVEDGVVHLQESGNLILQLLVDGLRTADEPDGTESEPPLFDTLFRRPDQLGMVCQAEVVVGAEVDDRTVVYRDGSALLRLNHTLRLKEACVANLTQFIFQSRSDRVHRRSLFKNGVLGCWNDGVVECLSVKVLQYWERVQGP